MFRPRVTGGFGQQQQPAAPAFGAPAGNTAFGAPSGGGLFGGVSAAQPAQGGFSFAGGGTAFGAPQTSAAPSLFGAPKPATTFGGGFGNTPAAGGGGMFGGGSTGFGAQPQQPQVPGTASVAYTPTVVYEPHIEGATKPTAGQTPHQFQSISAMDAYKTFSFEELRWQDYQAGRKQASAPASTSFGGASTFGGGAFGQPAQQQQPSAFGQPAPTPSLFGQQQPATSTFGQPAQGGLFGQPAQSAPTAFGAAPAASPFGQPAQPAAGGLFGGGASTFGQPAASTSTFGSFGAAAQKPASSFSFGGTPTSAPAPTGGLFGAQPQQAGGLFGQQQPAAPAGGLFGQPQQPAATGGFGFGASAAPAAKSLFGQPATSSPFGAPAAAAPKPAFGFGAPAAGGSLFGQPQQPAQTGFGAQPGGLFGGGSTFGQAQPAQQPPASSFGLFGAPAPAPAPVGGGLFGGGGSLFGQPAQPAQPQQPAGGSLFGSSFGNSFGGAQSTSAPQQPQQPAYATADDPGAYGSQPLFANINGPTIPTPEPKKRPPIFASFKGTPVNRSSTKITRLRGFGNSMSSSTGSGSMPTPLGFSTSGSGGSSTGLGMVGSPNRGSPLRLVNGLGDDAGSTLSPHAFISRPNVKKLTINKVAKTPDPKAPPRAAGSSSDTRPKVTFNPEVEFQRGSPTPFQDDGDDSFGPGDATPVKRSGGTASNLFPTPNAGASDSPFASHRNSPAPSSSIPAANISRKRGEYYSIPSLEALQKMPASSLRRVENLVVGCEGIGKVRFLEPVDLTTLESVKDLYGGIIRLEDKNASVYPDNDWFPKPEHGSGLNVSAEITLHKCWPLDKEERKPITGERARANEKLEKRLEKHENTLAGMEDTKFVSYDRETGTWVFTVTGF
ncbi:nuclear pore complex protein Nup98-Nup96, partial [Phenoliferia sp. Uapishka_3]